MSVTEGCASFSDTSGNLLFYTDGITVWDRAHQVMPNGTGLLGNSSSTQSAIVVPKPGSNYSMFYIFTVDDNAGPDGLRYSEVDMTLNGGFGDITSNKNMFLATPVCEKVTAIRHGVNVNDFWVIAHEWNTARFFSYLVTSGGVNTTPVISNTGVVHLQNAVTAPYQPSHGYMKGSVDGSKLAVAVMNAVNMVQVLDFDNTTGQLSNPISMTLRDPYGIEFSPSGRYLYAAISSNPDTIFQYDLQAANIPASKQIAGTTSGTIINALQLANNGKIYGCQYNQSFLSVINNPDTIASACGFAVNAVALTGSCLNGLPNFFVSLFLNADYTYADTCFNDGTTFNLVYAGSPDSVFWDFDDPLSGALNFSNGTNPQHTFVASGQYDVSCIVYDLGISDTVIKTITINALPIVNLGNDTTLCDGQAIQLSAGNATADSYLWNNSTNNDSLLFTASGQTQNILWVELTDDGCVNRDSITINSYIYPSINLGIDTTVCGSNYVLDANPTGTAGYTYLWQDNSTGSTFNVSTPGQNTYSVEVNNNNCKSNDTIQVTLNAAISAYLGTDIFVCPGDTSVLFEQSATAFNSYLWSNNATTTTLTTTTTGLFWLEVTLNGCTARDTIEVNALNAPIVNLGTDTTVCEPSYTLNANPSSTTGLSFLWQDGTVTSTYNVTITDLYIVTVSNAACSITDSINVTINPPINVDLGPDRLICDNIPVTLQDVNFTFFDSYFWSTGSASSSQTISTANTYILTVTLNGCVDRDTIEITTGTSPSVYLGADNSYCSGDIITLDAGNSGATYLWQNGSTTQTIFATQSGMYFVGVTSGGCTGRDTVNLIFDPSPILFPVTDTTICEGTSVFLDITNIIPGFSFQWSDGYPDPYRNIVDEGTYVATVTSGNCSRTSSFTVRKLDIPEVYLGEDTVLCIGGIWVLNAYSPSSTYLWQDGTTESTYTTNYAATYGVQVTNQCGVDVDSIELEFVECNCFVVFPSAFTPNHDLKNDEFNFKYDCLAYKSKLKIYNRWGMLVFESENPELGWDGTYEGKDAVSDIYVYILEYEGVIDGNIQEKDVKGTFLLYR